MFRSLQTRFETERELRMLCIILLRYSFAAFLLAIGIDKVLHTNVIEEWETLIGPAVLTIVPLKTVSAVSIEGIVEILLAVGLCTKYVRIALAILLVSVIPFLIDLFILEKYNLLLHNVLIEISALVLLLLLWSSRIARRTPPPLPDHGSVTG